MADINNVTLSAGSSPTVKYTITYTKSRPSNSQMKYNFKISCALSPSTAYIRTGYALLCTVTVNGSSGQVRIKANDNDNWEGSTPRVKNVSVTCASTTGNATQAVTFKVVSDGRLTLSSGVITNSSYTVLSSPLLTTNPVRGTVTVLPNVFETATIKWSGFKNGTNNAIARYELWYQESSNNSTWDARVRIERSIATTVSQYQWSGGTRGNYYRFNIVAMGTVENTYSDLNTYTSGIRKNTAPTKPSSVSALPAAYSTENIKVSWSGASGGTSAIKGYQVASRTSTDDAGWNAWDVLTTLTLSASSGSYTDTAPSRTAGTYTQYGIWTIDALNVYSAETISASIRCNVTPCGAPTSFSLSSTIAEGNVTLLWSGATGGAGNAINAYEIQYSESADGYVWGGWTALSTLQSTATSGTLSITPPVTRGDYRRFQIRVRGAAGVSYYSPWKVSSNSVQKNVLPTPPTVFTASPAVYQSGMVTLEWSGTVLGTSAIKSYNIQKSTSTDGQITWLAWETAVIVTSSELAGSAEVTPTMAVGAFTRYRMTVTDSLNGVTGYIYSNIVQKNTPPLAPIVSSPKLGSKTYNNKPICLIQTQPEPDGNPQTIWVRADGGNWYNSADNPEYFTTSGSTPDGIKTVFFFPEELEHGSHTVAVEVRDEYSSGMSVERIFTIEESPFEDIIANETLVKATHMTTLRTAANDIRNYYNLAAYQWSSQIISGRTQIRDWPFHILELRAAVQGAIDFINLFDLSLRPDIRIPPIGWIDIGTGRPRADVMNQLRDVILTL